MKTTTWCGVWTALVAAVFVTGLLKLGLVSEADPGR